MCICIQYYERLRIVDYRFFVFDLDGTLIDTSPGIFDSLRSTERELGLKPLSDEQLNHFIGPPLIQSFVREYGVDLKEAERLTDYYRIVYRRRGIEMSEIYPGIRQTLRFIREKGCKCAVATLKQERAAYDTLEHFDILREFDTIIGNSDDFSCGKAEQIRIVLQRMGCTDLKQAVMFGDSLYDGEGAQQAGVDFVPLTYGFGFSDRTLLEQVPHVFVAEDPMDLPAFVKNNILQTVQ